MAKNRWRTLAAVGSLLLGTACHTPSHSHTAQDSTASDSLRALQAYQSSLAYFEAGDTLAAIESLRVSLKQAPHAPYLLKLMGFFHYAAGRDDSALFYYRQALELEGPSADLHHRMASAFLLKKDFAQAEYHLKKAIELDSTQTDYWTTYGLGAYLQKRYNLAEAYWKKALALDSTAEKPRSFLYDLYLVTYAKPDTAKARYLDPYWRLERFHPLLNYQLGLYYLHKSKQTTNPKARANIVFLALEAFSRAILAHPTYAEAYYQRGLLFFENKKYDKALDDFARAHELKPKDPKITFMLGSLYEYKSDTQKALHFYEKTLALDSTFQEAKQAIVELRAKF